MNVQVIGIYLSIYVGIVLYHVYAITISTLTYTQTDRHKSSKAIAGPACHNVRPAGNKAGDHALNMFSIRTSVGPQVQCSKRLPQWIRFDVTSGESRLLCPIVEVNIDFTEVALLFRVINSWRNAGDGAQLQFFGRCQFSVNSKFISPNQTQATVQSSCFPRTTLPIGKCNRAAFQLLYKRLEMHAGIEICFIRTLNT